MRALGHGVSRRHRRSARCAKASIEGKDVRIGGGASTIRQYLQASLIDEMHLAVSPVVTGKG
jgi:dihydrofolate reductase